MLSKDTKQAIIKKSRIADNDTGSTRVQISLLDERVKQITAHLKQFPKDKHSHRGLMKILGQRRRLEKYAARKGL